MIKNLCKLLILSASMVVLLASQAVSAQIRTRGITSDLTSTNDQFLSLDLNGDGRSDLLYWRAGGGYANAYLSHGDGTFQAVQYVNAGTGHNGFPGDLSSTQDTFVALDLNGDGKSDFIQYRPGAGYTFKCLSNGDGTVACSKLSDQNGTYQGFKDPMTNGGERIVALDLNHDGRSDFIVYIPGGGSANAYLSNADGTLQEIVLTSNSTPNISTGFRENMRAPHVRIVPLDLNGDGYTDLLVYAPESGVVRTYLNLQTNTFSATNLSLGGADGNGFTGNSQNLNAHAIELDFNGDGRQDFLWWEAGSGTVIEYASNGDGTVTAQPLLQNGTASSGFIDTDRNTADTAVKVGRSGPSLDGFLWYSPGQAVLTGYQTIISLTGSVLSFPLLPTQYHTSSGTANGFNDSNSSSTDTALALNFLSGNQPSFAWYQPGSGLFQTYAVGANGGLSPFSYVANPSTFLSDLAWSIENVPLKGIVMPGTHDAVMYGLGGAGDENQTQWESIPDQLNDGARVFDFRVVFVLDVDEDYRDSSLTPFLPDGPGPTGSGFYMYGHSTALTNRSPFDIISELETWLLKNPDEIIVLDMNNQDLNNKQGFSAVTPFVNGVMQTVAPQLIYTQQVACGSTSIPGSANYSCKTAAVQPQNMTIAQLKVKGSRLILISGETTDSGLAWPNAQNIVGYCASLGNAIGSSTGGRSTAAAELDCINNGDGTDDVSPLTTARPTYQAADAATTFMVLKPVLSPFGAYLPGETISGVAPLILADGSDPFGFNVGSNPNDLNNQFINGSWTDNALNAVYIDGLRANDSEGDPMGTLIIERNKQTWINQQFFNAHSAQRAGALSIGTGGDIWAAGAGHSISIFKYINGAWQDLINSQPNVTKLAVDPQGGVWLLTNTGQLVHYDRNGANMQAVSHYGHDVAVGADGSVWYIGSDGTLEENSGPTNGAPDIYSSVPTQVGTHVAIDNRGYPWVIANNGTIQRFDGTSWRQVGSTQAKEIVASKEGSIFIVGFNSPSVGRYNTQNNDFDFLVMDASHVAVEPGGQPWAIRDANGAVYKGSLDQM